MDPTCTCSSKKQRVYRNMFHGPLCSDEQVARNNCSPAVSQSLKPPLLWNGGCMKLKHLGTPPSALNNHRPLNRPLAQTVPEFNAPLRQFQHAKQGFEVLYTCTTSLCCMAHVESHGTLPKSIKNGSLQSGAKCTKTNWIHHHESVDTTRTYSKKSDRTNLPPKNPRCTSDRSAAQNGTN